MIEDEFSAIAHGEGGDLAGNKDRLKALIQIGEISIRHLGVLHDLYMDRVKLVDAEVRRRKRAGMIDSKSKLSNDTIGSFVARYVHVHRVLCARA